MKKVLVPTDFSENALKAALYATKIASKAKACVYLLHVVEPIDQKVHQPFPLHEKYVAETVKMRESEISSVKVVLSNIHPEITIETAVRSGNISTTITEFAEKNAIDLIVMGTKGATGLKELFVGSNTSAVVTHTKRPVMAIPANYSAEEPDGILLATKHFEKNSDLLEPVVELAKLFSAKIYVMVFVEKGKTDAVNYLADTRSLYDYINYLQKTFQGIRFQGELLEGKGFEEAVEQFDINNQLDIVSMITYPKSFWEKLFKGSATRKMTFHSKIPVLAIPADYVIHKESASLPVS